MKKQFIKSFVLVVTMEYQNVRESVNFCHLKIGQGMLPGLSNRPKLYSSFSGSPCTCVMWDFFHFPPHECLLCFPSLFETSILFKSWINQLSIFLSLVCLWNRCFSFLKTCLTLFISLGWNLCTCSSDHYAGWLDIIWNVSKLSPLTSFILPSLYVWPYLLFTM